MADVFISYHDKTNGARAAEIAAALESAGISCWYARRDVPAGGDFTHEVITQIEKCKVFLLLLDGGAARSPHVENEVANAFGRKKIMPYRTDKKDIKSVSWIQYYLKQVQIVPLPDYNQLAAEIATALGRPVRRVTPKPQPVQPKPKPKPKLNKATQIFLHALTLIFVIAGSVGGCMVGRQKACADFFELTDFWSGAIGAYMGYFIGWVAGYIIWTKATKELPFDKLIGWQFQYVLQMLWVLVGLILWTTICYVCGGIFLVILGLVSTGWGFPTLWAVVIAAIEDNI